jgi:hypothetical protein
MLGNQLVGYIDRIENEQPKGSRPMFRLGDFEIGQTFTIDNVVYLTTSCDAIGMYSRPIGEVTEAKTVRLWIHVLDLVYHDDDTLVQPIDILIN